MFDESDKDKLARLGFFYLQWASGKSCVVADFEDAYPLAKKYFGVTESEFFFGKKRAKPASPGCHNCHFISRAQCGWLVPECSNDTGWAHFSPKESQ